MNPCKHHIPQPKEPITWNAQLNAWTIWQYDAVVAVLKSPYFSATTANFEHQSEHLPAMDHDPVSARQHILSKIQQQLPWARQKIERCVSDTCLQLKGQTSFDLQQDLIQPCCEQLALELTGCSELDKAAALLQAAQTIFLMNEPDKRSEGEAATLFLSHYFLELIAQRRQNPKEDFISSFVQGDEADYVLLSPIIQLFVGLATSLPLLLGNILFALLKEPEQLAIYQQKTKLSLSELLRFAGPSEVIYRIALQEQIIGNKTFQRGDRIALLLHRANHDASKFEQPDCLNLKREAVAHLSFGKGIHACLGAPIIRDVVELMPYLILQEFPKLEAQITGVKWGGSSSIWGVIALPVTS